MAAVTPPARYDDLHAVFVNCTLKRSPEISNTHALMKRSIALLQSQGVSVDQIRLADHDVAEGVYPDMREHGWEFDEWVDLWPRIKEADILVLGTPIWLGEPSSVLRKFIERLYGMSGELADNGQYVYYGKVAGLVVTGNEDGVKHSAMSTLYSLQHIGYTIPPAADAGWIGEVGPGPSYLDEGSGGPQNDFTNRNTTFMTWNLLHLARMLKDAGGIPAFGNLPEQWTRGERWGFSANPEYR
ncbi:flavodoxin family protein [uncultured Schumannella sp.]|uniref:flavodoxin family protein n=1 Tax=uncultured Schumannella sp. TaxID=1195956 RepID=UPI0025DB8C77|nr:flavodoxin family protein [uncultured Schumannella sp.]